MQRHGERAHEDGVFALAAHRLGQEVGMGLAEALGRGQLEIPVHVLKTGAFVRDHEDAGVAGLLENGLQRGLVVRNHADHVHAAGDQVLDGADLECGVGAGRADHLGLHAEGGGLFLDPGFHRVEPGDAADLDDHAHRGGVLREGGQREQRRERGPRQHGGASIHHVFLPCCAGFLPAIIARKP
jgi:hypothetical protein